MPVKEIPPARPEDGYYFPEPEVQMQMYPQYVGFIEAKYIVTQPKEVIPGYDET